MEPAVVRKKENRRAVKLWIRLGCARSQGNRRLSIVAPRLGEPGGALTTWGLMKSLRLDEMAKALRIRSHGSISARLRHHKGTFRETTARASLRREPNRRGIALDKIPPLSHLHSPQHLRGLRFLRQLKKYQFGQIAGSNRTTQD
jgi:hypothetical protein